jgi:hypothetical protein
MYGYVYDTTGYITKIVQAATEESVRLEMGDGDKFILSDTMFNESEHYVKGSKVLPRSYMPLTVTGSVIVGIPQGATVTLGEQSFTVDDGEADIEGYTGVVKIKCWPYLDAEVTL